jgi:hypothetical protein
VPPLLPNPVKPPEFPCVAVPAVDEFAPAPPPEPPLRPEAGSAAPPPPPPPIAVAPNATVLTPSLAVTLDEIPAPPAPIVTVYVVPISNVLVPSK